MKLFTISRNIDITDEAIVERLTGRFAASHLRYFQSKSIGGEIVVIAVAPPDSDRVVNRKWTKIEKNDDGTFRTRVPSFLPEGSTAIQHIDYVFPKANNEIFRISHPDVIKLNHPHFDITGCLIVPKLWISVMCDFTAEVRPIRVMAVKTGDHTISMKIAPNPEEIFRVESIRPDVRFIELNNETTSAFKSKRPIEIGEGERELKNFIYEQNEGYVIMRRNNGE